MYKMLSVVDEKTRKGISTGVLGLSLILCLAALFGPYWLTLNGYEGNFLASWSLDEAQLELGDERSTDSLSELCELEEEMVGSSYADTCDIARAGAFATVFLWLGVLFTSLAIVHAVLPSDGVEWVDDNVPEIAQSIVAWSGGSLMLVGVVVWYVLLPDIGSVDVGGSAYLALFAGVLGLGSVVVETYEIDVNIARRER
jgi:hypothetical protein